MYKTKLNYIQLIINEIHKIKYIETNIPNNILPLLSHYGTFYDGGDTFYCYSDLDDLNLTYCIINHIIHYCRGFFITNTHFRENIVMQHLAKLDLVKKIDYDFDYTATRHFHKIYRDEFKNMIYFGICDYKLYSKHMMNLIENKLLSQATIFQDEDQISLFYIQKNINNESIFNNLRCKTLKNLSSKHSSYYYDCDFLTKIKDTRYNKLPLNAIELLKQNNFEYEI